MTDDQIGRIVSFEPTHPTNQDPDHIDVWLLGESEREWLIAVWGGGENDGHPRIHPASAMRLLEMPKSNWQIKADHDGANDE